MSNELSFGNHGGCCAICLDTIPLQETAMVKGCEHAYWYVLLVTALVLFILVNVFVQYYLLLVVRKPVITFFVWIWLIILHLI